MNDTTLPDNLRMLGDELVTAAQRLGHERARRQRVLRTSAFVAVSAVALAGGAVAAERIFGAPAPEKVKESIAALDDGLPADIRLNPDVTEAYSVAESETAVLYYAALDDGGYCTQLVISGAEHAATCITAAQAASIPLAVQISTGDPGTTTEAVTIAGHVNAGSADRIKVKVGSEARTIAMGDDGFFVFDLSSQDVLAARTDGIKLSAIDSAGNAVAANNLSDIFAEGPHPVQPIDLMYRSEGSDLTLLLGLDGKVNDRRIVTLELHYPDGTTEDIPLEGRRFHYVFEPARQDDFADEKGLLVGLDAKGKVIAGTPVASVAWWRAAERNGQLEQPPSND